MRKKISIKILGIKDVPLHELEPNFIDLVSKVNNNTSGNKMVIIKTAEKENKKNSKLRSLKYGIGIISTGILGSFATKYFLRYGLQREYIIGMSVLSTIYSKVSTNIFVSYS